MAGISRIGIIDLGTNSIRFDVHRVGPGTKHELLKREKQMIRLGEGVFMRGKLDPAAANRAIEALLRFRQIADGLSVERMLAFGTCTLREVSNAQVFLERIREKTGIEVRIISGEEEAKLIALGILSHEPHARGKCALIDIGGGSTEITVARGGKILHCDSFPLGAARLQQLFLGPDADTTDGGANDRTPLERLRRHVRSVLTVKTISEEWPKVKKMIGSSGTVRAVSRILKEKRGSKVIHRSELSLLVREMARMTPPALAQIPGMEPNRVDIILAGAILLEQCMEIFDAKVVYPTGFALRDGILLEEILRQQGASAKGRAADRTDKRLNPEIELFPLYAKACRLGCHEAALKQLVANADFLFRELLPLHKLDDSWSRYLAIASIFRDTGWSISPVNHERHSYYVVKNAELPLEGAWQVELIAQLCLRQDRGKIGLSRFSSAGISRKKGRRDFPKLLALMRVLVALGPAHQETILLRKVKLTAQSVTIGVNSIRSADLLRLRLESKAPFFEKVFGRKLTVTAASTGARTVTHQPRETL